MYFIIKQLYYLLYLTVVKSFYEVVMVWKTYIVIFIFIYVPDYTFLH